MGGGRGGGGGQSYPPGTAVKGSWETVAGIGDVLIEKCPVELAHQRSDQSVSFWLSFGFFLFLSSFLCVCFWRVLFLVFFSVFGGGYTRNQVRNKGALIDWNAKPFFFVCASEIRNKTYI